MTRGTCQPVVLLVDSQRDDGEVRLQRWTRSGRLRRAGKALGMCWGLATASVLLPGVHFVLVPAFLLAGPILAVQRWSQKSGVLGGVGRCPACRARVDLEARPDEWPLFDVCSACHAQVRVQKASAQAGALEVPPLRPDRLGGTAPSPD